MRPSSASSSTRASSSCGSSRSSTSANHERKRPQSAPAAPAKIGTRRPLSARKGDFSSVEHSKRGSAHRCRSGTGMTRSRSATTTSSYGWHDPRGQAEQAWLADSNAPGSWGWMIHKAHDHTGYGGRCVKRGLDTQVTAISGDTPDWMVGVRTVPGPFDVRSKPVRRCPNVQIKDGKMHIQAKTYLQGPHLNIVELPVGQQLAPAVAVTKKTRFAAMEDSQPWRRNHMESNGVQTKAVTLPRSAHRTYEAFDPGPRSSRKWNPPR